MLIICHQFLSGAVGRWLADQPGFLNKRLDREKKKKKKLIRVRGKGFSMMFVEPVKSLIISTDLWSAFLQTLWRGGWSALACRLPPATFARPMFIYCDFLFTPPPPFFCCHSSKHVSSFRMKIVWSIQTLLKTASVFIPCVTANRIGHSWTALNPFVDWSCPFPPFFFSLRATTNNDKTPQCWQNFHTHAPKIPFNR